MDVNNAGFTQTVSNFFENIYVMCFRSNVSAEAISKRKRNLTMCEPAMHFWNDFDAFSKCYKCAS